MKQTPLQRKTPMARKPMKAKRKRKKATQERWRSPDYIEWIKQQPCMLCGMTPCDPHHVIGLPWNLSGGGLTAPDNFAMSLCRTHHRATHDSPEMQRAQPTWLRWTLTKGIRHFDGETRAELVRALQFIDER